MIGDKKQIRIAWALIPLLISFAAEATDPRFVIHTVTADAETQVTVEDAETNLEWQQGPENSGGYKWVDALAYCETLDYGGYQDWRLPSAIEISSLVDERRETRPAINTTFFVGTFNTLPFWTSTTNPKNAETAYAVDFRDTANEYAGGGVFNQGKGINALVLCVRSQER